MWNRKIQFIWMVIWLTNVELCTSSGTLSIRFLRFRNNNRVNNNDCCDNLHWCNDGCDHYFDICMTEVSQAKCNAGKFRTKVLGEGSFTFPGIGGDLGNGRRNPVEYSFQKWKGFALTIDIWDYDGDFIRGSNDFVDKLDLDIVKTPDQNSSTASNKQHTLRSANSPNERYLVLETTIYCDVNYLVPDCARKCVPRDDARGHYTCDYVNGRVVCNEDWYGENCTAYCRPRNDGRGNYTCDIYGGKICADNWFGGNCSTLCKNTDDPSGHYNCDPSTGGKVCMANWYGKDCLVFCKAQDEGNGHYLCDRTSGEKVCVGDWYGDNCTKYCSPQNDRLLGHFKCDVTGEKVCLSGWHGDNCTQAMTALITCHDKLELWIDGVWYGPDNGEWKIAWSFQISTNATLIAVKATDDGNQGGILGSLSSGLVTDESWKCSERFHGNWMTLTYDDSNWKRAKTYGYNGVLPWVKIAGIADNANWIWTADQTNDVVYCRRVLTEIIPTVVTESLNTLQTSYTQMESITSPSGKPTHFAKPTYLAKSTYLGKPRTPSSIALVSPSINSNQLQLTSAVYSQIASKYNITSTVYSQIASKYSMTTITSLETSSTTKMLQFLTTTLNHYPSTKTINKRNFKTTSLSSFLSNTKTSTSVTETILIRQVKSTPSLPSFTATPELQKLRTTITSKTNSDHSKSRKTQTSLATETSHDASGRDRQSNYLSTMHVEISVANTLLKESFVVSSSIKPSRMQQNTSRSPHLSTNTLKASHQELTHSLHQTKSFITTSNLIARSKTISDRTKVTFNTKVMSEPASSEVIYETHSPVSPTRSELASSEVIYEAHSPVSPTRSAVMTSSSVRNERRRKKFTFIVKLRHKWQNSTEEKQIKTLEDYKDSHLQEVNVSKRKECKDMILLDIFITYTKEKGLNGEPKLQRIITTIVQNVLNASEVFQGSNDSWECSVNQSGRKVLKEYGFVLVFVPTVAVMMVIGTAVCIRIKHKKRLLTKVVPVSRVLIPDGASKKVFKIPHSHSQQELLQMYELTSKAS